MKAQLAGVNPVSNEKRSCAVPSNDKILSSVQPLHADPMAAALLGVAEATLRKSRCTGVLLGHAAPVFIKQGRRVRYRQVDLLNWLVQFQPCRNTLEAQSLMTSQAEALTSVADAMAGPHSFRQQAED